MFPPSIPSPPSLAGRHVQSVSELTTSITVVLESEFPFVAICGEISSLRQPFSGHLYFTLKDENAQIRCVLFKGQQRYLASPLKEGEKVICRGRISVYKQRGEYQIIVDHVVAEGVGKIQLAFEQLKEKLAGEGLFDSQHKKKLPPFATRICLITSPSGAAVHDFIKKALERFPGLHIEILPAAVQGDSAAQEIKAQLVQANKRGWADIIIISRGGGSPEDLAAFNDEELARAIFASELPVVSAVGHEVDFSIADFVADHRSPTPTAAAEEIVPDYRQQSEIINSLARRANRAMSHQFTMSAKRLVALERHLRDPQWLIEHYRLQVDHATLNLAHHLQKRFDLEEDKVLTYNSRLASLNPKWQISKNKSRCENLLARLSSSMEGTLNSERQKLTRQGALLEALSPLAVLGRGYALAMSERNEIINSIKMIEPGDRIKVRVADGLIEGVAEKKSAER